MSPNPLVSVVMPLYNAGRYLTDAIDSIQAQTYPNIEVIAVNDGSTDDTATRIQPYLALPGFKYLEQTNKGVSAARNTGLRAATGEMIAFLDHDDRWLPDKLAKQVAFFLSNPDVGLVHGNISFMDSDGCPLPRSISDFRTDISGWCFKELFADNHIATLTVCIRRKCYEQVGFFREDIRGGEDYEYWLRVARKFKVGFIDEDLAVYRLHDSNATKNWLPQLIDISKALEGVLLQFPDTRSKLGRQLVKHRLLPIHMRIARELCRVGNYKAASPHLLRALALQPVAPRALSLLVLCFTPTRLRSALRWYWHRLFG